MNQSAKVFAAILLFSITKTIHPQLANPQSQEGPPTDVSMLQVHVNAVLVPVVVRDSQGQLVRSLKQEDFKVFDQGKQRRISGFSIQNGEIYVPSVTKNAQEPTTTPAVPSTPTSGQAQRFIVFLFDDRHLSPSDLDQVKRAETQLLDQSLPDGTRAVVLSFLGVNSGMTHDRVALKSAIAKMKPRSGNQRDTTACPDIDYYTADRLINKHSKTEWDIAIERTANCSHMSSKTNVGYVEQLVRTAANQTLVVGEDDVRATLIYLRDVVHSMSKLSGQRSLILVSPGFLSDSGEALTLQSQILNIAAATNVTINTLDARGLFVGNTGASQGTAGSPFSNITGQVSQDHLESMRESEDVMAELADGTGGTFFHNNNDLRFGLENLTNGPEFRYLLEISLQNVKPNGAYHLLKVELDQKGLKLQARRGYFAPLPPTHEK